MRHATRFVLVASILAAMNLAACSCGAPPGRSDGGRGADTGAPVDTGPRSDTGVVDPDANAPVDANADAWLDRTAFCMGMGPPVIVGDATLGTETCAGSIASRVFNNSVCSCENTNVVGYLQTRSFHSGTGMTDTSAGAPVGVDRDYLTGGYADIGGSFVVSGTSGVAFAGYLKVGGDARFGGNVNAAGYINISRDFWVLGNVTNIGLLAVHRDLHQPSGRTLATFPMIDGSTIRTRQGVWASPPQVDLPVLFENMCRENL